MKLKDRVKTERGAVLVTVALVMTVLILLVAGGISTFTMFGAQRELQKAADQAALAAAAAVPLAYTGPILGNLENLPFPDGVTDPVFNILDSAGLDIPRLSQLAPDPRAVACAYGQDSLESNSASLINAFGTPPASTSPICSDNRVVPTMQSTALLNCVNGLVGSVTNRVTSAVGGIPLLSGLLTPILTAILGDPTNPAPGTVRALVNDLNMVLPALLSPRIKVEVSSGFRPPMLSIITGEDGMQMKATAVAQRRLKNAVVIPITPGSGIQPSFNLNTALGGQTRDQLLATLNTVNTQLNNLTSTLGVPGCNNLLSDLQTDISDIYNPPSGPAPSMLEVARVAAQTAQGAAGRTGVAVNDLGEAFLLVGTGGQPVSVSTLLAPLGGLVVSLLSPVLGTLQIPALDVVPVVFRDLGNGDVGGVVVSAANARGLFQATLVN